MFDKINIKEIIQNPYEKYDQAQQIRNMPKNWAKFIKTLSKLFAKKGNQLPIFSIQSVIYF